MKDMEKLAPLFLALSWSCGWSCPHHTVADIVDMAPNLAMKTIDIFSKKYFVITRCETGTRREKAFVLYTAYDPGFKQS